MKILRCKKAPFMPMILLLVLLVSTFVQPAVSMAFSPSNHDQATQPALECRVSPDAMEAIKKANKAVDDAPIQNPPAYQPPGHFDRDPRETSKQAFERNAEFVRNKKQEAIDALKRCDTEAAIKAIGEALHAIQDFYAHSNYVDLTPAEQAAARNAFDNPCTAPANLRLATYYPIPSLASPWGKKNPLSYNPQSLDGTAALWWLGVRGLIKETDPRDGAVYDHGLYWGKHKDTAPVIGWFGVDLTPGDGGREITRDKDTGNIVRKNTPNSETKRAFEWAMEAAKKHSQELIDQIIEEVGQALWDQKLGKPDNYKFPKPPDTKPASVPLPDPKWKLYPYPYPYPYHRLGLQVGVFGLVPPEGGILDDGEGTAVFVPSGAVPTPEWFYALSVSPEDLSPCASLSEGKRLIKAREFWPDSTQFQEPVTISIVYSLSEIIGVTESSLRAYEFDLYHDGEWRLIPDSTLDTVNRTVTFQTSHFGIYGVVGGIVELPTITSITPDHGNQGETLDVVITGTNFTGATAVSFGAGITVNSFKVNSSTQITANITIDQMCAHRPTTIFVTTSAGTATLEDGFTVGLRKGCFIATAAYGTPMAEEIDVLRDLRDRYLLTNEAGKALVELYYRVSPPMAEFITEHPALKPVVRAGLAPAIAISAVAINTAPVEKGVIAGLLVLVSVALAIWAARRRGRSPEYT